jgi:YD repeat-containing protein
LFQLETTLQYDPNENPQDVTDPRSKVWQWTYDPRDRVETETSPLSTLPPIVYAWDGNSNLLTRTDRLGQVWDYHYGSGRGDRLEQV